MPQHPGSQHTSNPAGSFPQGPPQQSAPGPAPQSVQQPVPQMQSPAEGGGSTMEGLQQAISRVLGQDVPADTVVQIVQSAQSGDQQAMGILEQAQQILQQSGGGVQSAGQQGAAGAGLQSLEGPQATGPQELRSNNPAGII